MTSSPTTKREMLVTVTSDLSWLDEKLQSVLNNHKTIPDEVKVKLQDYNNCDKINNMRDAEGEPVLPNVERYASGGKKWSTVNKQVFEFVASVARGFVRVIGDDGQPWWITIEAAYVVLEDGSRKYTKNSPLFEI